MEHSFVVGERSAVAFAIAEHSAAESVVEHSVVEVAVAEYFVGVAAEAVEEHSAVAAHFVECSAAVAFAAAECSVAQFGISAAVVAFAERFVAAVERPSAHPRPVPRSDATPAACLSTAGAAVAFARRQQPGLLLLGEILHLLLLLLQDFLLLQVQLAVDAQPVLLVGNRRRMAHLGLRDRGQLVLVRLELQEFRLLRLLHVRLHYEVRLHELLLLRRRLLLVDYRLLGRLGDLSLQGRRRNILYYSNNS